MVEISPEYDRALVTFGGSPPVGPPLIRQRLRFLDTLRGLSVDEWAAPSRCEGWRVQDVAAHLVTVDRFWHASISNGVAGTPTRFLVGFDPKATPAALVDAVRGKSHAEALDDICASASALCELVAGLSDDAWSVAAESPLGHISVAGVAHHALWDAWVHERDVVLPLGLAAVEEADEVLACLRQAAAINAAFAVMAGAATPTTLVLESTDPQALIVVGVAQTVHVDASDTGPDPVVLRGRGVDLVEMLSTRVPFDQSVAPDKQWLLCGLADVFEVS
jgi:uncharacterized protein (TIGR03083 family)